VWELYDMEKEVGAGVMRSFRREKGRRRVAEEY
jgi:hypothetical protein